MAPTIHTLSQELLLRIADLLLEENRKEIPSNRYDEVVEILAGDEAIQNLSRSCRSFYNLLAPYIFKNVTLRNSEKSGKAVQFLCGTPQINHVKTIHFKSDGDKELPGAFEETAVIMPAEVKSVLSNLNQMPKLETLIIDLNFHQHEVDPYEFSEVTVDIMQLYDPDEVDETDEEIKEAEVSSPTPPSIGIAVSRWPTICTSKALRILFSSYWNTRSCQSCFFR